MRLRWQKQLLCLCALLGMAHSGVVSTQETMVVARSDDTINEQGTTEVPVDTAATDEPLLPVKLTEMEVKSEVSSRYSHTAVVTRVRNPAKKSQEATFRVLLPETAFISGFTMILDGKPYKAYVKEKEEAKQIYTQAVSQGIGAAHIAAKARDSNHFTVSVNVEPNTMAVFNLTYEELLTRRNGVYNHAINLHPGALVPRLTVTVHIKEANKIKVLRVPEMRTGNEIDATDKDAQNSKAVIVKSNEDREATITFTPNLEEQQALAQIYTEKTKDTNNRRRWYSSQDEEELSDGVLGQFVVQYDVDRPSNGEVLVNDGYFVHFFAPSSLVPLNKHVVFVLDTSGSMLGRKIEQLREAMQTILGELNQGDYFNIVEFASSVYVHDLKEADEENAPKISPWSNTVQSTTLYPPAQATPENIEKAKVIIRRLDGGGATAISTALSIAIDLVQKGIGWTPEPGGTTPAITTLEKDAEANKTPKVEEKEKALTAEKPVANKDEIELEPIIIFLTDGEPTTGETNLKSIINIITEKNYGKRKASIFSLAFGEGADRDFLRKLSLRNDGFMRHIYEASDAALQLHDFYRQVSSPLLSDVKFTYPPDQVKENTLTKYKFRTFYDGSETVVAGKLIDANTELKPEVSGFCGVADGHGKKRYEIIPKVPKLAPRDGYFPLERLWAYLTIKQLLDERDAAEANDKPVDKENGPEKKALTLALKYEFVTPLTSLVVVKPNATNAVNAESVDKDKVSALHGSTSHYIRPSASLLPSQWSSSADQPEISLYAEAEEPQVDEDSFSHQISDHAYGRFGQSSAMFSMRSEGSLSMDRVRVYSKGYPSAGLPGIPGPPLRDPIPFYTTPAAPLPSTTENLLEAYHLQEYAWVNSILNTATDSLSVVVNGTTITLKVTKDEEVPKNSKGDEECSNELSAKDGAIGLCVYLTRCKAAKYIPLQAYSNSHCSVNGYAGVCCPRVMVDQIATTSQLP